MEATYVKCHKECFVHQCIKAAKASPEKICEWSEDGICVLDTASENDGKMSLESIGVIFGVTRERIRQIEDRALKKLKKNKQAKQLFEAAKSLRSPSGT